MSEYLGRPRVTVLFTLDLGYRRQSVIVTIKKRGGVSGITIEEVLFIIVQKTSSALFVLRTVVTMLFPSFKYPLILKQNKISTFIFTYTHPIFL